MNQNTTELTLWKNKTIKNIYNFITFGICKDHLTWYYFQKIHINSIQQMKEWLLAAYVVLTQKVWATSTDTNNNNNNNNNKNKK